MYTNFVARWLQFENFKSTLLFFFESKSRSISFSIRSRYDTHHFPTVNSKPTHKVSSKLKFNQVRLSKQAAMPVCKKRFQGSKSNQGYPGGVDTSPR